MEQRQYRIIDFKRDKDHIPAKVASIEYDPNRSAHIALLHYVDGEKRYILAPSRSKSRRYGYVGRKARYTCGKCASTCKYSVGSVIHQYRTETRKRRGQLVRSAGNMAQLMAREDDYAQVRLPSGEVRMISVNCKATIGQVGNVEHENIRIGKAGRVRWMGRRPHVHGVVMNPSDHPHGGGEGKSPIGMPSPVTPWGKPTLGYKTRKKKNRANKFIGKKRNTN